MDVGIPPSTSGADWKRVEHDFWKTMDETHNREDINTRKQFVHRRDGMRARLADLYHERHVVADRLREIEGLCSQEESRLEELGNEFGLQKKKVDEARRLITAKMERWFSDSRATNPTQGGGQPLAASATSQAHAYAHAQVADAQAQANPQANGHGSTPGSAPSPGPAAAPPRRQQPQPQMAQQPQTPQPAQQPPPQPPHPRPHPHYSHLPQAPVGLVPSHVGNGGGGGGTAAMPSSHMMNGQAHHLGMHPHPHPHPHPLLHSHPHSHPHPNPHPLPHPHSHPHSQRESIISSEATNALVCNFNGEILGPIRKLRASNLWVDSLLTMPIRRHILLRAGYRFTTETGLQDLYEPTDHKFSRWIACMIQASGTSQARRCLNCERGHGPFDECVIADGDQFPRCGNCEWTRSTCQGAVSPRSGDEKTAAASAAEARGLALRTTASSTGFLDSGRTSLSGPASADGDRNVEMAGASDDEELLTEITPENLVVKHDGTVYTDPECVRGVPVAKVDPSHPYWDPSWVDIKELIEPQLEKWRAKHDTALKGNGPQHAKFQIGRQVNRGHSIIAFIERGEFCPYQLLAKSYMNSGKGGITSYDTLFRLINTIEELQQFKVRVNPVDWVRHRLYEIMTAEADRFNLAKTMHDFYHDPKLSQLRTKSGFRNIGRPSNGRMAASRASLGAFSSQGGINMGINMGMNVNMNMGMAGMATPPAKRRKSNHGTPRSTPPPPHAPGFMFPTPPPSGLGVVALSNGTNAGTGSAAALAARLPSPGPMLITTKSEAVDEPISVGTISAASDDGHNLDDGGGYVTDLDSTSGEPVSAHDFRLIQVRHRRATTHPDMPQYWHFSEDEDGRLLDHQALKDMTPPTWGTYRAPLNFGVSLAEMREVRWARGSLKVHVAVLPPPANGAGGGPGGGGSRVVLLGDGLPRGDVAVLVPRTNTHRRLLRLLQSKGVRVAETSFDWIEDRWNELTGEMLPATDEQNLIEQ